ncbi:hypothetical protein [Lactococcus allomyrinae]|uniref:Uncharacterized protein n=1 Tax=Lactococcus allomyrinae TaxID=2419773 RepID=A0A387B7P2_9LACT|nr:hypothetical protein [Lactococcus allomyrinae]AYF99804.1 hypothetical protein D7I46_01115 [Lactococcus allomyrinae]
MMTFNDKINWLKKYYPYKLSRAWYEENPVRTCAIYRREYHKWYQGQIDRITDEVRAKNAEKTEALVKRSLELFGKKISQLTPEQRRVMFTEALALARCQ